MVLQREIKEILLSWKQLGYDLKHTVEEADAGHVEGHSRKRNGMCKGPNLARSGCFEKESGPLCLWWTV